MNILDRLVDAIENDPLMQKEFLSVIGEIMVLVQKKPQDLHVLLKSLVTFVTALIGSEVWDEKRKEFRKGFSPGSFNSALMTEVAKKVNVQFTNTSNGRLFDDAMWIRKVEEVFRTNFYSVPFKQVVLAILKEALEMRR